MSIINTFPGNPGLASSTKNGLMSATDKAKLDGIASGANSYTHPTTHPASIIVQDANNRFVTDTQISTWNAKANSADLTSHTGNTTVHITAAERTAWNAKASTAVATTNANGLMSSTMVTKLNGIAEGATKYTHPDTHPASIIVQDANNRFVTDAEKAAWNAKAGTAVATTTTNGLMSSTMVTNLNNALTRIATLETNYASMLAKLKTAVFYE